ncbi:hypothetical protein A2964_02145 [Candidatus Daviesbacteria bacterium RIFCSPLOWO2_01_FULL_40_27]|nr:MAG: hypothetical protein A2964_02145 [Candidatus Daviesbacteria bacterium RIFCSPLOWO2_01_FULL_40_27]
MEVQTIQKYIHTPPRKLRLVSDMVRSLPPTKALNVLQLTPKMAAKDLVKALQTALANAKQAGMDSEKVFFKKIEINESMKMRRFRAGTRGRVKPYKKRMSHIKIVLTDDLNLKSQMSNVKTAVKLEKKKESMMDDSAVKSKSTERGRTESSK